MRLDTFLRIIELTDVEKLAPLVEGVRVMALGGYDLIVKNGQLVTDKGDTVEFSDPEVITNVEWPSAKDRDAVAGRPKEHSLSKDRDAVAGRPKEHSHTVNVTDKVDHSVK